MDNVSVILIKINLAEYEEDHLDALLKLSIDPTPKKSVFATKKRSIFLYIIVYHIINIIVFNTLFPNSEIDDLMEFMMNDDNF
jgi:hypothetical protein